MKQPAMDTDSVILFDGMCNLCSRAANFMLSRDSGKKFRFASLQSEEGKNLLSESHDPKEAEASIILYEGGKIHLKSTAIFRICRNLDGFWKLFSILLIVPIFIRDGIYDIIAGRRYRWFGAREQCRLPSPGESDRFL